LKIVSNLSKELKGKDSNEASMMTGDKEPENLMKDRKDERVPKSLEKVIIDISILLMKDGK